ncbi:MULTISPECIES: hypothetical protein [unclassified Sulfitobacter]|uniref:hypothetical protein n=1 Tax=unclassified Sulfitobacter TaxID=196795 RepID=UPI0023E2AE3F|nr:MULTISPECIES: hypothetical protein [unclassified Sulfitobacter]
MFDDIVEHFGDNQTHHADLLGPERKAAKRVQQKRKRLPRGLRAAVNGDLERAERGPRGGEPHRAIPDTL